MKYEAIVAALREDVLAERLPRKQKIPSRQKLCERFGASPVTVQRAVDRLVREGVLETSARQGTFVSATPPCVSQVALIFPFRVYSVVSLFWDALSMSAVEFESQGMRFVRYHQISGNEQEEGNRRLLTECESGALAGLVFVHPPAGLVGTSLLSLKIPKVTLMRTGGNSFGVQAVCYDADAFMTRAVDLLQAQGMKRVAVLNPSTRSLEYLDQQTALFSQRGMMARPSWIMGSDPSFPHWTHNQVRALVDDKPRNLWPEALVITDDNLVKPAVDGLLTAGVRIPDDIRIVAHCNYPALPHRAAPITWLGFDTYTMLKLCLESLERQRTGRKPTQQLLIPPLFEDEREGKQTPP